MESTSSGGTSIADDLPNLIIVGVTKAGTTSLFRYLSQHPDIAGSDEKELRYFMPLRYGEPLPPMDTYLHHFRHRKGERYAMEATPNYYYGGRPLAIGLREKLPEARVIVVFREPVDRCWSWYNFVRSKARIPKEMEFEDYLDRCMELRNDGVDDAREHQAYWGLGGGCYAEWVGTWLETFGNRFMVQYFDDVVKAPADAVAHICGWLGLPADAASTFAYHVENKTELYKHKGLQQQALKLNRRSKAFFERHRGLKRLLRKGYLTVNREASERGPSAEARARLQEFYLPHNERLRAELSAAGRTYWPDWVGTTRPDPRSLNR